VSDEQDFHDVTARLRGEHDANIMHQLLQDEAGRSLIWMLIRDLGLENVAFTPEECGRRNAGVELLTLVRAADVPGAELLMRKEAETREAFFRAQADAVLSAD